MRKYIADKDDKNEEIKESELEMMLYGDVADPELLRSKGSKKEKIKRDKSPDKRATEKQAPTV